MTATPVAAPSPAAAAAAAVPAAPPDPAPVVVREADAPWSGRTGVPDTAWPAQPATDAWTATVARRVASPFAVGLPPTARRAKAYILTVSTASWRYRYTALRAAAAGMTPVAHIGRWPAGDTLRSVDQQKACATKYAHRHAWARHAADPAADDADWAFFFEDDVAVTPPLRGADVHVAWRRVIASPEARLRGFVSLGLCGQFGNFSAAALTRVVTAGERLGARATATASVDVAMTCGVCMHAYGVRRDVARSLWAHLDADSPHQGWDCNATEAALGGAGPGPHAVVNADSALMSVCTTTLRSAPLVGANLASPLVEDHKGVFFQDRSSFASVLAGNNYGQAVRPDVDAADAERAAADAGLPGPTPSAPPQLDAAVLQSETGRLPPPACAGAALQFTGYAPSLFEREWAAGIGLSSWSADPCAKLREAPYRELQQAWLNVTIELGTREALASGVAALSYDAAGRVLSRMQYRDAATGTALEFGVEPMAGLLRDPRPICGPGAGFEPPSTDVQSHEFLLLDPALLAFHAAHAPAGGRRVVLFDLGATRWADRGMPGMRWLFESFEAGGLRFTDIYAWEADPARSAGFFDEMPADVVAMTRFFNAPVDLVPGSPYNVLELIAAAARPADVVVVKLDIDTPRLEEAIILRVLAEPSGALACLVDEIFFEHHVANAAMMAAHWGPSVTGSIHESLRLFQALRRRGIRMHSWP